MAQEIIARAALIMILALILLSHGTDARTCGTFLSPLPLCNESKDACIAYCINERYATGVCYGGGGDGGLVCVCQTPCSEEEAAAQGGGRRAAGGVTNRGT
ncbi:hypothetical protein ACP70R_029686 [Stipagrostis hirtigluma subsp. patula]